MWFPATAYLPSVIFIYKDFIDIAKLKKAIQSLNIKVFDHYKEIEDEIRLNEIRNVLLNRNLRP